MNSMSTYFSDKSLRFLRSLATHNDREWFAENKPSYIESVQLPFLSLIEEVTRTMEEFAPAHVRPANKIALRIYRDTRFSADKRPYKRHVCAWWGRNGMLKTSGAGYYLQISGKEVLMAAGLFMPTPEQLAAERAFLNEYGAEVQKLLSDKKLRRLLPEETTERMARVPRGYAADSPNADLLRRKRWGVSITQPARHALAPAFVKDVIAAFKTASPLVDMLNRPLVREERKPRQNFF